METGNSVVEFFYNIVPGVLFVFLFAYYQKIVLCSDPVLLIFLYIILGLFLGFVFQAMTKIVRNELHWNIVIAKKVKNENLNRFDKIYAKLSEHKRKENICDDDILGTFYLMDNSLRGINAAFLPTHFSARFAFWSNIFFSLMTILVINIFFKNWDIYSPWLLIFAALSLYIANKYFYAFYDSILKTYYVEHFVK